jgi:hypothetical protein
MEEIDSLKKKYLHLYNPRAVFECPKDQIVHAGGSLPDLV